MSGRGIELWIVFIMIRWYICKCFIGRWWYLDCIFYIDFRILGINWFVFVVLLEFLLVDSYRFVGLFYNEYKKNNLVI